MDQDHYLIVDKQFEGDRPLDSLFAVLLAEFELDGYTARQRLLGRGPALLTEGPKEKLDAMAQLLKRHHVKSWLLVPTPPLDEPARVLGLQVSEARLTFQTRRQDVALFRNDTVIAVLADLSGAVRDKNLKRLLIQSTYRGTEHIRPMSDEELHEAILRAEPILDLYILSPDHALRGTVRVLPRGFDPSGLGGGPTYLGIDNFKKLYRAARDHAGTFVLQPDFGLAPLPGCRLKITTDGVDHRVENLRNLTRFGWLMVDIFRAEATAPLEEDTGAPAIWAGGTVLETPDVHSEGKALSGRNTASTPAQEEGLPLPPLYDEPPAFPWRNALLLGGGTALLVSATATLRGLQWVLNRVWFQGIQTGILPALFALALIRGGFYFLRLTRQVENTPTSKARSMAMGMVEIHGRALRQYALVSPMTQLPCVYYHVRKYRQNGRGNWRLSGELKSGPVPFYLEDETGRVSIDPQGASIRARSRRTGNSSGLEVMFGTAGAVNSDEKWVEETIPEGTFLYVLGHAGPRRHAPLSLRDRTIAALRDLKFNHQALRKYDSDGDGKISQDEWEVARVDVEEAVLHQALNEKEAPPQGERIVIARAPVRALPFVIAETESEAHLTRNYRLWIIPLFVAGATLALWAVFEILRRVGI